MESVYVLEVFKLAMRGDGLLHEIRDGLKALHVRVGALERSLKARPPAPGARQFSEHGLALGAAALAAAYCLRGLWVPRLRRAWLELASGKLSHGSTVLDIEGLLAATVEGHAEASVVLSDDLQEALITFAPQPAGGATNKGTPMIAKQVKVAAAAVRAKDAANAANASDTEGL